MKKLTAGIFAGILTIVAVNAAHADIATTTYVKGAIDAVEKGTVVAGQAAKITEANTATEIAANASSASDAKYTTEKAVATAIASAVAGVSGNLEEVSNNIQALNTKMSSAESDIADLKQVKENHTSAIEGLQTEVASQNETIADLSGDISQLDDRLETAEGKITTLTGADNVDGSVANAKKAGTDAAAALTEYQATQNTKDSGQDAKITALEEKVGNNKISDELALKMNLATGTQNKLLTTDANGQVIQAVPAVTKPTKCTEAGAECMLVDKGNGLQWELIVNEW